MNGSKKATMKQFATRSKPYLFFALIFVSCHSVSASVLVTNSGPGIIATSAFADTYGFDFTVGTDPLLVTALGIWDENSNGLANSHSIGLWTNSGTLLGMVTIPSGNSATLSGQFRFVSLLLPVTLSSGQKYVLGAGFGPADADRYVSNFDGQQATFDSAVSPGISRFAHPGFGFPSLTGDAGSVVGPNASFTVVPEPGTAVLLFSATILLARRRVHR